MAHTTTRELYLRDLGRSRVAYIPWDIDRSLWDVMCVDHLQLLRNTIEWTANEPSPVVVKGPGLLDVTVWRQRDSMTVHLVNLTNPMMMKGPLREVIPIGSQQLTVRLPEGSRPKKVQLLTAGKTGDYKLSGTAIMLTVPSVDVHEVVAIDL